MTEPPKKDKVTVSPMLTLPSKLDKEFKKAWDQMMNKPSSIPIIAPFDLTPQNEEITLSNKGEEMMKFTPNTNDNPFAPEYTAELTSKKMKIEVTLKLEFNNEYGLSENSAEALELLKDVNKNTKQGSKFGAFKRMFKGCQHGNSCTSCNNKRFLEEYLKKKGFDNPVKFKKKGEHDK